MKPVFWVAIIGFTLVCFAFAQNVATTATTTLTTSTADPGIPAVSHSRAKLGLPKISTLQRDRTIAAQIRARHNGTVPASVKERMAAAEAREASAMNAVKEHQRQMTLAAATTTTTTTTATPTTAPAEAQPPVATTNMAPSTTAATTTATTSTFTLPPLPTVAVRRTGRYKTVEPAPAVAV